MSHLIRHHIDIHNEHIKNMRNILCTRVCNTPLENLNKKSIKKGWKDTGSEQEGTTSKHYCGNNKKIIVERGAGKWSN